MSLQWQKRIIYFYPLVSFNQLLMDERPFLSWTQLCFFEHFQKRTFLKDLEFLSFWITSMIPLTPLHIHVGPVQLWDDGCVRGLKCSWFVLLASMNTWFPLQNWRCQSYIHSGTCQEIYGERLQQAFLPWPFYHNPCGCIIIAINIPGTAVL